MKRKQLCEEKDAVRHKRSTGEQWHRKLTPQLRREA